MKMSLDGFHKVKKEGNLTTLKHPSGHEMTINHSILSPKMRGEIEALPSMEKDPAGNNHPDKESPKMFADGGDAEDSVLSSIGKAYRTVTGAPEPSPSPAPEEDRSDKYAKIRARNATNAEGKTSALNFKDGGEVKEEHEDKVLPNPKETTDTTKIDPEMVEDRSEQGIQLPEDIQVAKEEADAQKAVDQDPNAEVEQEQHSSGALPDDHAKSMIEAHNNAMEAHNNAMKLYAASQAQPQAPARQPASAPQQASQQAPAQAPAVPAPQDPMQAAQQGITDLQAYHQQNQAKNQQLFDKVMSNQVDPNRLFNNQSTVNRITTTIGLILGGLGAGANGGRNMAADAINKAVERDVDAQKSNQSAAMNMYKMNLEATHNDEEARALTINQQLTLAQAQLAKQAANTQNQAALQNMSKVNQEIIGLKQQNTMNAYRAKALQDYQNGSDSQASIAPGQIDNNKITKLEMLGIMPKEDVEAANKEAASFNENRAIRKDFNDSFHTLNKKFLAGALTPGDRAAYINTLAAKIEHANVGRYNHDAVLSTIDGLFPKAGDSSNTRKDKLIQANKFFDVNESNTPVLDRYKLVNKNYGSAHPYEGMIAINEKGQKIIMKNGKWDKYNE